ncbi:MAG: hypothetical protein ACLQOO_15230 [Terriglobia bacterium]
MASTWWSIKRNHFFRTEATDLLKTQDRVPGPNPNTNPFPKFSKAEDKRDGFSENRPSRVVHVKVQSDANGRALSQRKKREGGGLRADSSQERNVGHLRAGTSWGTGVERSPRAGRQEDRMLMADGRKLRAFEKRSHRFARNQRIGLWKSQERSHRLRVFSSQKV